MTEERAPKGYAVAETITFTVSDSLQVQQVTMYDKEIEVAISKQDITSQKELPGAELTVADDNGNVIEKWISTEEPHMVNLPAGTYTLTEIAAPERYAKAETITFEVTDGMEVQSVVMYDKPIEVSVSKLDVTNDQELPGAKLIVKDQEGKEIESWISTEEPHKMNLAAGTIYPDGSDRTGRIRGRRDGYFYCDGQHGSADREDVRCAKGWDNRPDRQDDNEDDRGKLRRRCDIRDCTGGKDWGCVPVSPCNFAGYSRRCADGSWHSEKKTEEIKQILKQALRAGLALLRRNYAEKKDMWKFSVFVQHIDTLLCKSGLCE